jgi:hypothetical protein
LGVGVNHFAIETAPGTYGVTIVSGVDDEFVRVDCDDSDSTTSGPTATVRVAADELVRCVFVNQDRRGGVVIEKQAPADQQPGIPLSAAFHHTVDGFEQMTNQVGPGLNHFIDIDTRPGTYTALDVPGADDEFVGARCNDLDSTTAGATATIRVQADELVRCVFVNQDRRGGVVIEKQAPADQQAAVPVGAAFNHDVFGSSASSGTAAAGINHMIRLDSPPGSYAATDLPGFGDRFVGADCDDGDSTVSGPTATMRVQADELVRCVFVNEDRNSPPDLATNVTLVDDLPQAPGLQWSLDQAVPGCEITGSRLACSLAGLADDAPLELHVTSPTTRESCGAHTNTATARADNRPQVTATDTVTVVCPPDGGTLVLEQATIPGGTSATFSYAGAVTAALKDGESTPPASLPAGAHVVTHVVPAGWQLAAIACADPTSDTTVPTTPVAAGGQVRVGVQLAAAETVTCTFTHRDAKPPVCTIVAQGVDPSTGAFIRFRVQDAESGLVRYRIAWSQNAAVAVDPFTPPTLAPVFVDVRAVDPAKPMGITIEFFDGAGRKATCDPIIVLVTREERTPVELTFTDLPAEESLVTVTNGSPGLTHLEVRVNNRRYVVAGLEDGERRTVDVAAAMAPGATNTVVVVARGKPGGSAVVMLADVPSESG